MTNGSIIYYESVLTNLSVNMDSQIIIKIEYMESMGGRGQGVKEKDWAIF